MKSDIRKMQDELFMAAPTPLSDREQQIRNSQSYSRMILTEAQKQLAKQRKEHASLLRKIHRRLNSKTR